MKHLKRLLGYYHCLLIVQRFDGITGLLSSSERILRRPRRQVHVSKIVLNGFGKPSVRRVRARRNAFAGKRHQRSHRTSLEESNDQENSSVSVSSPSDGFALDSGPASLDSPLSQMGREEDEENRFSDYAGYHHLRHYQSSMSSADDGGYSRNEDRLEEATADVLDLHAYPTGTLTIDDCEAMSSLMAAWARRGSVHAALNVEKLLKRIVDDINAGNPAARVRTRHYTFVSSV